MSILYVTMTRREKRLGWLCLPCCVIVLPLVFGLWASPLAFFLEKAIGCAAVAVVFRRFLRESFHVPLITPFKIGLKAVLGLIVSYVVTIFMNDLFFFYLPDFFAYTDFGPMYYNVNEAAFAELVRRNFLLTAVAFVVLTPIAEEVLFRGLLFGQLCPRSKLLAYILSVGLFAFLPVMGLMGQYPASYLVLNFLQYVPLGLALGWVYTSTETIITPIALRMVLHALAICAMR